MKWIKAIITVFLIIIFSSQLLFRIVSYKTDFITPFNANYWTARYFESQWVIPASKNPIGDDGLYAYEGWEYIHGANPTLLNAEVPPLGKYIIGFGEVLFGNQNILILIIGFLCLFQFYLLNIKIFKSKLLSFIPVFAFSFDPLFYSQLRAPYLDTIYLLFLLFTLYFVMQKKYLVSSIFLGCFAAVKFPLGSIFLALPIVIWVFTFDRHNIKKLLLNLILWPITFSLFYTRFFILGGTFFEFLGVQKWTLSFYAKGAKVSPGIIYPLILFGKWHTWFGGIQKVAEWNILWPLSFIATIFSGIPAFSIIQSAIKKHKKIGQEKQNIVLIFMWCISYLIFLSFTPVFPRYLLLLLPFMYNLTIWFLVKYAFPRFS